MEEDLTPNVAEAVSRHCAKAREILDGISGYRIHPSRLKMADNGPGIKGGNATVAIGTLIPPERVSTWILEELLRDLMDSSYAIKKLKWDREDVEESVKTFKLFVNELKIMSELSHDNIIKLMGFVEDVQKGDAWIVLPWEANGNVREFLQSGEWDIPERISLIQDVVKGVEYLHTRQPPVCHGDLKSLNILVNSSYHAVITDFGSARNKPDADDQELYVVEPSDDGDSQGLKSPHIEWNPNTSELTLTGPDWSLRWTAPELLKDQVQDLPSDMWAVGWICWEIVTGKLPFEELQVDRSIVLNVIHGELPKIREDAQLSYVLELCGLMSDCWISDPKRRIRASNLEQKLRLMPSVAPSISSDGEGKMRSAALLLQLGEMHRRQDDTARAEAYFKSVLEVAARTKDQEARANAFLGLGEVYRGQCRYMEAVEALRKAHEIHSRIGNDWGTASALGGLGSIYRSQSRNGEAEETLRESHQIHSRIGNDLGTANALDGLGDIYRAQSRNREAEEALREAHEIHSRIANDQGIANALHGLGEIYRAQSRNREAEAAWREAHGIHSRIGNDLGTANALHGLGSIYRAHSRNREAEEVLREAHGIYSRIGNDLGTPNTLDGLGSI